MLGMDRGSFALWQCLCTFAWQSIMLVVVSPFMGDIEAIVCGAAAHCEWEEYSDHSHIALYLLLLLLPSSPTYIPHWSKFGPNSGFFNWKWYCYTYVQESIATWLKWKNGGLQEIGLYKWWTAYNIKQNRHNLFVYIVYNMHIVWYKCKARLGVYCAYAKQPASASSCYLSITIYTFVI